MASSSKKILPVATIGLPSRDRQFLLVLILLILSGIAMAQESRGTTVSEQALVRDLQVTADRPLPRKVLAVREEAISCRPTDKIILVVQHRASLEPESLNDDVVVMALRAGTDYKVLESLQSDAGIVDGRLDSQIDFNVNFISIDKLRFLYVRERSAGTAGAVMDLVYTISSDGVLSEIPFADFLTSKLLKAREKFAWRRTVFEDGHFLLKLGIYSGGEPECCPTGGTLKALYRLEGRFEPIAQSNSFRPQFRFVIAREWRSPE